MRRPEKESDGSAAAKPQEPSPANYVQGQILYWEWTASHHGSRVNGMVAVASVGRKWLTLDNGYRVDKGTLVADGGSYSPPGRCFVDKVARQAEVARDAAWSDLRRTIPTSPPNGVDAAAIATARRLLGF